MKKRWLPDALPAHWLALADQVLVSGISFATHLLLAQSLGLAAYGAFAAVLMVQLFILSLHQATVTGIFQVVYPRLSAGKQDRYVRALFWLQAPLFGGLIIIGAAIFSFWSSVYEALLAPASVFMVLSLLHDYFRKVFLTQSFYKKAFGIDCIANIPQIILLLIFAISSRLAAQSALWIIGLTYLPSIIVGIRYTGILQVSRKGIRYAWLKHLREARWLLPAALLQWATGNYFIVAAGWYLGAPALGALRLAQYLFGPINLLLQAMENYFLPQAALLNRHNRQAGPFIRQLLQRSAPVFIPIIAGIAILGPALFSRVGGADTLPYGYVCQGLALVYLLVWVGYPVRLALRGAMLNKSFFGGYALAAIFSLATAPWLVGAFSLWGVLIGLFLVQLLMTIFWSRTLATSLT